MFRRLLLVFILAAFTTSSAVAQQSRSAPPSRPFSEVAAEAFHAWDEDGDGVLSSEEIDRHVVSPMFEGESAAALAAMKLVVRNTKVAAPELNLDFVTNRSREPAGELLPSETPNEPTPDATRPAPSTGRPPASLERRYQSALRKIRSAQRELFADGDPDITTCRQGPLGSCFFIAGVGAMVHRDPDSVRRMIQPVFNASGEACYGVTFGDRRMVTVPILTEAQFALTSSAGRDGAWMSVLEQAYGSLRMNARPESRRTLEASDALAHGGSLSTTLRALTGNRVERIRMRGSKSDESELVARVTKALAEAMAERRLAGASTGTATPLPPGINGRHAYAVLSFDRESELVELWNPHGNSFRPRGEAGRERGYQTRGGRFQVPVSDFASVFDAVVIETQSAASGAPSDR